MFSFQKVLSACTRGVGHRAHSKEHSDLLALFGTVLVIAVRVGAEQGREALWEAKDFYSPTSGLNNYTLRNLR